ncbi:MAG: hypothetical protein ACRCXT_03695 [Paraclostridium sp.]
MKCCGNSTIEPLLDIINSYDIMDCDIDLLLSDSGIRGNVNKESLKNKILAYREYMNSRIFIKDLEIKYGICKMCLYKFIALYELPVRENRGLLAYNYYMEHDVTMIYVAKKFKLTPSYFYKIVKDYGRKKRR